MGKDNITLRKEGALARIILNNSARLNAISMAMWDSIDRVLDKGSGAGDMDLCEALVAQCYASEDHREGHRAFMEKRKPIFEGR